jgi:hypothetical protein
MILDDVTGGCAAVGYVLAPCEICATSFRLKKIEWQELEFNITR